ncbi:MAG: AAA family ATPase, partial [Candidatus Scalindua sp.]|nr:AAA family ATPase [Candidatus Scalindua sp.]MCR4345272.1 AAA family ATPase [Candidatus Scalindua sp.]
MAKQNLPDIPNYEITEKLGEGLKSRVYKAFHRDNQKKPLALKILKGLLSAEEKSYFYHKAERLKVLNDNQAIIPLSFEEEAGFDFITQDYFSHLPLSKWQKDPVSLSDFFWIASSLSKILISVHEGGIIHGGIKPNNILIKPASRDIRLIDFISFIDIKDISHFIYDLSFVRGTLAYTSPEQSGRINHRVDFSTDLYSLGIIFYELLTGKLPYFSIDPLELIHSHLAKEAPDVHEINPEIPVPVADIIAKLLFKEPEKRYQSGNGLLADLIQCQDQYVSNHEIKHFPLGINDFSRRVIFISKMVGRDQESQAILEEYNQVVKGEFRSMFISGLPGIGKTRLIQELQRPLVENRCYFTSGKFDQYQKNIPYSSLIQALRNLMRTFLTESDEQIEEWKKTILHALGESGRVITDIVPELEIIIGPQPKFKLLPPVESRNRFNNLFGLFLSCIASEKNPVVLFIDDLQWCDVATFDFFNYIFANSQEHKHLFFIGAYRHSEVDSSHPLSKLIHSVKEKERSIKEIRIHALNEHYCHEMVSYILDSPIHHTESLASFVTQLTEGNPLFVCESLSYLHGEELLFFNDDCEWQWDINKIRESNMPSTVVAMFRTKVERLPAATHDILFYCACMGNRFTASDISIIKNISLLYLFESFKLVLSLGLLIEIKSDFQFVHDRVQEAVLNMLTPKDKKIIHWKIGTHLLSEVPGKSELESLDNIFTIAAHLNLGKHDNIDAVEAYKLSDINFHAGNKALNALAIESANEYFRSSKELLPDDSWQSHYQRTFKIYTKLAKTELMCGRYETSEQLLDQLIEYAESDLDRAEALAEQTTSLSSIGNFIKAIETANRGLAYFGQAIPEDSKLAQKRMEDLMAEIDVDKQGVCDKILNMRFTNERKNKIELAFYSELIPDLYMSGLVPQLYLSAAQSTQHCLSGGMDESVIYSFSIMGLNLGEQENFKQAFMYEDLAHELCTKYPNTFGATRGMNGVVWCNMHSRSKPSEIVDYCLKTIQCGKNCGDLYNAGLSYGPLMWNLQVQGHNLQRIEEYANECLQFSQKYNLSFSVGLAEAMIEGWVEPMKNEHKPANVKDKIEGWIRNNHVASAGSYTVHIALCHYYFGQFKQAESYLKEVNLYLSGLTDNVLKRQWYVFRVLNTIRVHVHDKTSANKEALSKKIRPIMQKIETWSKLGPLLVPYLSFIYAEIEAVTGNYNGARNLYLDAIISANEHGYTFLEGHINQCLGELLKKEGSNIAKMYFVQAVSLYKKCHAERKISILTEKYPYYFKEKNVEVKQVETVSIQSSALPSLDIEYLIKTSLVITAEHDLEVLLHKVMNVVLESSGAQDGYLLINEEGKLIIRAENHIYSKSKVNTNLRDYSEAKDISKAIINLVFRVKEKILLDNAMIS